MPPVVRCAALAALACAVPALAAEPASRDDVLAAIRTFEAKTCGVSPAGSPTATAAAVAAASNTILNFATTSDDVLVDFGPDSVPWCDVKRGVSKLSDGGDRGLLFAAYLAGSVKAQLKAGRTDPNPCPGWVAMLKVYRALKMREGIVIPEAETLLSKQMDGSLENYAATALARSREKLRREYGSSGQPAAPVQGSGALAAQP